MTHTLDPGWVGYRDHPDWAAEMSKTHEQKQCPTCKLWVIWQVKGTTMKVGDRVKTTKRWNDLYYQNGLRGTILKIPLKGKPVHPERNHYVDLDEPLGRWTRLWFDPNDLEPEGS